VAAPRAIGQMGSPLRTAIMHVPDDQALGDERAQQDIRDIERRYNLIGLIRGDWAQLVQGLTEQLASVVVVSRRVYRSAEAQAEIDQDDILSTVVIMDNRRLHRGRHRGSRFYGRPTSAEQLIDDAVRRWRAEAARWRPSRNRPPTG
jgi:hypothetical protein